MSIQSLRLHCIIFMLLLSLMTSCTSQDEADQKSRKGVESLQYNPRYGGIYRFPLSHNPSTLDPPHIQDVYGIAVAHQVFDRLVQFSPHLELLPALAESWRVEEEGKIYRFFLRQDAFFHDGSRVGIEDVIFSIKRLLRADPPAVVLPHFLKIRGAQEFRNGEKETVDGLQAIGDHELLVHLTETHMPFLAALGSYQASIIPKHIVLSNPSGFGKHPVGSGPFKLISWEPNQSIQLRNFPAYYGGAAYLDGIEYLIYPGAPINAILSDFRNKKIDEMHVLEDFRKESGNSKNFKTYDRPLLNLFFYGMNCQHPKLSNIEFRKALFEAIDRKKLIQEVYKNQYEVASTILPPGLPGYQPAVQLNGEFRENLSSFSKYTEKNHSIEIVSSAMYSDTLKAEFEFVCRAWEKIGVSVDIKYITNWTEFEKYIKSDAVQIYRYDWTADIPDTDSFLYPLFASDSPVNFTKYHNNKVDGMLLKARGIIDPVERANIYRQIDNQIMHDLPIIPLFHLKVSRIYQPYIQGVNISALGIPYTPLHRFWISNPGIDRMTK